MLTTTTKSAGGAKGRESFEVRNESDGPGRGSNTIINFNPVLTNNLSGISVDAGSNSTSHQPPFQGRPYLGYNEHGYEQRPGTSYDHGYEQRPAASYDLGYDRGYDHGYDQRPPTGYDQRPPTGFDQRPPTGFDQRPPTGYDHGYNYGYDQRPATSYDHGYEQRTETSYSHAEDTEYNTGSGSGDMELENINFKELTPHSSDEVIEELQQKVNSKSHEMAIGIIDGFDIIEWN